MAIDFLQFAGQAAAQSTFTFSSQNLGAADAGRYILVAVAGRSGSGSVDLNTVTVAGITATPITKRRTTASGMNYIAFLIAAVPTGTSGNVVVTHSGGNMETCGIALYRIVEVDITPFDIEGFDGSSQTPNITIDAPANGTVIAAAFGGAGTNPTAESWTGVTEDYGSNIGAHRMSGGNQAFPSGVTAQVVTCTWSPGSALSVMVGISLEEIVSDTRGWWAF